MVYYSIIYNIVHCDESLEKRVRAPVIRSKQGNIVRLHCVSFSLFNIQGL